MFSSKYRQNWLQELVLRSRLQKQTNLALVPNKHARENGVMCFSLEHKTNFHNPSRLFKRLKYSSAYCFGYFYIKNFLGHLQEVSLKLTSNFPLFTFSWPFGKTEVFLFWICTLTKENPPRNVETLILVWNTTLPLKPLSSRSFR